MFKSPEWRITELAYIKAVQDGDAARTAAIKNRLEAIKLAEQAVSVFKEQNAWPTMMHFYRHGSTQHHVIQAQCCSNIGKGRIIAKFWKGSDYRIRIEYAQNSESLPSIVFLWPDNMMWLQGFCRNCFCEAQRQASFWNNQIYTISKKLQDSSTTISLVLGYLFGS